MDVTWILQRLLGRLDVSTSVLDPVVSRALAAVGVRAAYGPDISSLDRPPENFNSPRTAVPTVAWSDPTALLTGDVPGIPELALQWDRIAGHLARPPWGMRVVLSDDTVAQELPIRATRLLIQAPQVISVACQAQQHAQVRAAPPWTWPLRLAVGTKWRSTPLRDTGDAPRWWRRLVVPVQTTGPWATASLAILDPHEALTAGDARLMNRSLRAAAVVIVAPRVTDFTASDLQTLAVSFSADFISVVPEAEIQRSGGRDNYLIGLITRLSHDVPLDAALHDFDPSPDDRAVVARQPEPPIIIARGSRLDDLQLRAAADRSARAAMGSGDPQRRHRAGRLQHVSEYGAFQSEAGDASVVAETMENELEARRRAVDRYLLADLEDPADQSPVPAPLPNADYALAVRIATPAQQPPPNTPAFPAAELFPDDGPDSVELTVVVTKRTLSAGETHSGQHGIVTLPRIGDSTTARFPVSTGPAGSVIDLRVAVLHRNRIVQTGLFWAEVGSPTAPTFTPEAAVRDADLDLDFTTEHQAALILNHSTQDVPTASVITPAGVETLSADQLEGVVGEISALLDRLVADPDSFGGGDGKGTTGYHREAFEDLMVRLARKGRGLHEALFGRLRVVSPAAEAELKEARRISILAVKPSSAYPLELLYDRRIADGLGAPKVRLCKQAPAHAADGNCPGNCDGADTGAVVCPFGFWGVSKIIERHVGGAAPERSGSYKLAIGPDVERHRLRLVGGLAAAADRANDNDASAWSAAAPRLGASFQLAQSWQELGEKASALRESGQPADILMLVTHTNRTREGVELEIGDGDARAIDLSWDPLVLREPEAFKGAAAGRPNPVVMVLGCSTAGKGSDIYGAPTRFLSEGAPAVVASITTVLGRHIVPVGVRLLEELRRLAGAGGRGSLLGEAMLAARRTCLLEGNAAVLALVSFGDTDWQLSSGKDG
jgi:hypothetical protein